MLLAPALLAAGCRLAIDKRWERFSALETTFKMACQLENAGRSEKLLTPNR
jgi:hypothetical protein